MEMGSIGPFRGFLLQTGKPGVLQSMGRKELDMTERLN